VQEGLTANVKKPGLQVASGKHEELFRRFSVENWASLLHDSDGEPVCVRHVHRDEIDARIPKVEEKRGDKHLMNPTNGLDLLVRPRNQNYAVSLDAFVFPHFQHRFLLSTLVDIRRKPYPAVPPCLNPSQIRLQAPWKTLAET
jgi:hypothetical protein